ncbi:phage antirepressor KilAC domain-containing protein [Pseudomonas sp. SDO5591_S426]
MIQHISYNQTANKNTASTILVGSGSAIAELTPNTTKDNYDHTEQPVTMSSKEIAKLTSKPVGIVHRDIRTLLDLLAQDDDTILNHVKQTMDSRGYTVEFQLRRREVDILLTGYSLPLRAKFIDRWRELEAEVAKPQVLTLPNFTNPAIAARAWASEFEGRVLALEVVKAHEQKIAEDAPKVQFYDDIAEAHGCHSVKQVANVLDTGRNRLYEYLRKHKVLISTGKDRNLPYQAQKNAGRFKVLEVPYKHPFTGKISLSATTVVTGKGLIFIRELIAKNGRDGL